MHSVSIVQCELVCYAEGNFADPVIKRMVHQLVGHDLELLPTELGTNQST